jgi:hypothetical protein
MEELVWISSPDNVISKKKLAMWAAHGKFYYL